MGLRFFKKFSPSTGVVLSNNTKVQFSTLDGVVGYFATDAAYVQDEFARLMSESRYDISEVDAAEFPRDYVEKKKGGSAIQAALARRANAGTTDAIRINPQREVRQSGKCCGRG